MSFKPFFVHLHTNGLSCAHLNGKEQRKAKGATFFVAPSVGSDRLVEVRVTFCSPKDTFSKKAGRVEVMSKSPVVMNKRDVPRFIAVVGQTNVQRHRFDDEDNYTYLYKYLL